MNINLIGKNALVCGSSKGIGKASAIALSALGANITLVARSPEHLVDALRTLDHSKGQHHDFLVADFNNTDDLKKKVKALVELKTIHILLNNTGGPPPGSILSAQPEDFLKAYNNHLICNHLLAGLVIPGMKKVSFGRIINIISTSVRIPIRGLGVSNTTRGAVASWAKTLANEVAAFGITVNNVLPGATYTDRLEDIIAGKADKTARSKESVITEMQEEIPMGRFGTVEEIASTVAFLASPAAAYITGVSIPVDGGRTGSL